MRILVTGALGFMGSWITDILTQEGHQVFGIDNLSSGSKENQNPQAKYFYSDLVDENATARIFSLVNPEVVFHLASTAREGASAFQPVKVTKNNFLAFIVTLKNFIKYKGSKFIHFSSMSIYGEQSPPFTEEMSRKPVDLYGMNKAMMEETLEMMSKVYEFRYTIIRPFNVIGPRQSFDLFRNVAAIFMNRIMRGEPIFVYGDGEQKRSFSPIRNSLPCYIKCLTNPDTDGETYNIGGSEVITINDLAEKIIKLFPEFPTPKVVHLPPRPLEVKFAWCDTTKAEKALGYAKNQSLDECLEEMACWAKEKGAQEWSDEELELINEKTPKTWVKGELR